MAPDIDLQILSLGLLLLASALVGELWTGAVKAGEYRIKIVKLEAEIHELRNREI